MRFLSFNCSVRSWEWWFLLVSTQKTDGGHVSVFSCLYVFCGGANRSTIAYGRPKSNLSPKFEVFIKIHLIATRPC